MNIALYSYIKIRYLTNLFISANIRLIIYYVFNLNLLFDTAMRNYINQIGVDKYRELYDFFENQLDSYGIENVDEIMSMDLTLIKRKRK